MSNRDSFSIAPRLLACAALLVVTAMPAAAEEPNELQKLFGAMGIIELPRDPIEYRERAPLVVPPSSALVQPRSHEDIRKYNPDWPIDHDSNKRSAEVDRRTDSDFYTGRPLRPGELDRAPRISREDQARRDADARRPEAETAGKELSDGRDRYSPAQLGFKGWDKKEEEKVVFTGEPERRLLTDPPAGLLTPSPDAPYGVVSKGRGPAKVPDFYDRTSSADDPNARR